MKYIRTLLIAGILGLAACQQQGGGGAGSGDGEGAKPVATVNGTVISRDMFDFFARNSVGKPASDLTEQQHDQLLDNLVRAEVIAQQASKDGLDKSKDTIALLELTRLNVLQQAVTTNYLKDRKSSDQELRTEYESEVQQLPKLEYHAKHILVATDTFAQKVIERLQKGEKFEEVARRESMDPSKESGGDLGWFTPDRMDKDFSAAVLSLKPGEFTKMPVHTQFGYHVIQLVETRDVQPPPFDNNVRQRVDQVVQGKKFRSYVDELMRNAKVDKVADKKPDAAAAPAAGDAKKN